jgi:hypothetical protein
MDYFTDRIPASRERLIADLGITNEQIEHLIENGVKYRARYADGTYGYWLLSFWGAGFQPAHRAG